MALIRPQVIQPRLAEIGRIYKGEKKSPSKPGKDLDHFRFEPSARTVDYVSPDGNGTLHDYLKRQWAELGDSPRSITIQFLRSQREEIFRASNEVWATVGGVSRCVRRCDGQSQTKHLIEKDGKKYLSKDPVPCLAQDGLNDCPGKCSPTGILGFIVPALKYPGMVVFTTHSINDIMEIQGNLAMYESWDLSQIPFKFCRTQKIVSWSVEGEQKSMQRWLCHLEIDPTFGQRILAAGRQHYLEAIEVENEVLSLEPAPMEAIEVESVPAERDWRFLLQCCAWTIPMLKDLAKDHGLPTNSKELNQNQSDELFTEMLLKIGMDSGVFKAVSHCQNSLAKLRSEGLGDIELVRQWMGKIEGKKAEASSYK